MDVIINHIYSIIFVCKCYTTQFVTFICSRADWTRTARTVTCRKISSRWFMGAFFGENRLKRVNSFFSLNDTSMFPFLIGRVFGNLRVHSSLATGDYPCRFAVCLRAASRSDATFKSSRSYPCNQTMLLVSVLFIEWSILNGSCRTLFAEVTKNFITCTTLYFKRSKSIDLNYTTLETSISCKIWQESDKNSSK